MASRRMTGSVTDFQPIEGGARFHPVLGAGGLPGLGEDRRGGGGRRRGGRLRRCRRGRGRRWRGGGLGRGRQSRCRRRRLDGAPPAAHPDDHGGEHDQPHRGTGGQPGNPQPDRRRLEDEAFERSDEAQLDVSQLDDVARVQLDALVVLAVDAHAVGALQVDDRVVVAVAHDLGVVPRDRTMPEDDVVLVRPPDDRRRPIQRELHAREVRRQDEHARRRGTGRPVRNRVTQRADRDRRLRVGDRRHRRNGLGLRGGPRGHLRRGLRRSRVPGRRRAVRGGVTPERRGRPERLRRGSSGPLAARIRRRLAARSRQTGCGSGGSFAPTLRRAIRAASAPAPAPGSTHAPARTTVR